MTAKEKVITVTLMWSDLYDVPAYNGAYLTLPASQGEIQDALQRARIIGIWIVESYMAEEHTKI